MPSTADVHTFVINALNQQRPDLALPWRSRLLEDISSASSLTLLAKISSAENDISAALTFCGEALRGDPYYVDAYLLRAQLLNQVGAFDEAIRNYQQVLLFMPLNDEAVRAIFMAAQQAQRPAAAVDALTRRLRIGPDNAELRNLLGLMQHAVGNLPAALEAYDRAIELDPTAPLYLNNRATILYHQEKYDIALTALNLALKLMPDYAVAWHNVGNIYKATGKLKLAEHAYRRTIALQPDYAEAHFNLGCVLLQANTWPEGWDEYEWRWKVPGLVAPIHAGIPLWQGEPIDGERILVVAEQGSGDTLQFARYLPHLLDLGAEIVVWAPMETATLLRRHPAVTACATNRSELPVAKYYVPMMSLPRLLNASLKGIPTDPYLTFNKRRMHAFLRELGPRQENLRLGIAWAGNPMQVEDRHRSATLKALAPLFDVPSVRWISIQKGARTAEIEPSNFPIEDWGNALDSFDTTAALVSALDGVVSICSAPTHLAGGLGIQTACMLSWIADWRWCKEPTSTMWYPNVKLIRQAKLNDWTEVAERTADLISTWKPKGLPRDLI
jgi:tetratricopeptide (TPR) repeat protein